MGEGFEGGVETSVIVEEGDPQIIACGSQGGGIHGGPQEEELAGEIQSEVAGLDAKAVAWVVEGQAGGEPDAIGQNERGFATESEILGMAILEVQRLASGEGHGDALEGDGAVGGEVELAEAAE